VWIFFLEWTLVIYFLQSEWLAITCELSCMIIESIDSAHLFNVWNCMIPFLINMPNQDLALYKGYKLVFALLSAEYLLVDCVG
jgi:hypothetical protein